VEPVGIVPDGDQELGGDGVPDSWGGHQRGVSRGDLRLDPRGQGLDLAGEVAVALRQDLQGRDRVGRDRVDEQAAAVQQRGDQLLGGQAGELRPYRPQER
jgi:hypothetical protein